MSIASKWSVEKHVHWLIAIVTREADLKSRDAMVLRERLEIRQKLRGTHGGRGPLLWFTAVQALLIHHKCVGNIDVSWWIVFTPVVVMFSLALVVAIGDQFSPFRTEAIRIELDRDDQREVTS